MALGVGHGVTADEYALGQGDWIDFSSSFTLTAATTAPTKGNATYTARYTYLTPHTVYYVVKVQLAAASSTFSVGSGAYRWLLPVTAANFALQQGLLWLNDSGNSERVGYCRCIDSTHLGANYQNSAAGDPNTTALGSAGPGHAWAINDAATLSITYEV